MHEITTDTVTVILLHVKLLNSKYKTAYQQESGMNFRTLSARPVVISLVIMGLLTGCDNSGSANRHKPRAVNVEVSKAELRPLQNQTMLSGVVAPLQRVRILNQEPGQIRQLPVYPGDRVKKHQLLVALDQTLLKKMLDKATAQFQQANVDLKRLKRLEKRNLASDELLARAVTQVQLAKAEKDIIQTRLSYSRISAPFDGIISERRYDTGDIVSLYSHILTLIDTSELKIILPVNAELIQQIDNNAEVRIYSASLGKKAIPAKIFRIYPEIDSLSHKGKIEIRIATPPTSLLPGELVKIALMLSTNKRLVVPVRAIRYDTLGKYVFIVNNNKVSKTRVTTGLQNRNYIEITNGIQAGEIVVTQGFQGLQDKKPVKIIPATTKKY